MGWPACAAWMAQVVQRGTGDQYQEVEKEGTEMLGATLALFPGEKKKVFFSSFWYLSRSETLG